jgi:hypothetical protein
LAWPSSWQARSHHHKADAAEKQPPHERTEKLSKRTVAPREQRSCSDLLKPSHPSRPIVPLYATLSAQPWQARAAQPLPTESEPIGKGQVEGIAQSQ